MYLQSKTEDNVKRKLISHEIAALNIDDYISNNTLNGVLVRAFAKGIKPEQIQYKREFRSVDEWNNQENFLIVYYEEEETDNEYKERINKLEQDDVRKFLQILCDYHSACYGKDAIKNIFDRIVTNGTWRLAEHQEKYKKEFFNEVTTEELINEAYDKGLEKGRTELKDFKKKLKELKI